MSFPNRGGEKASASSAAARQLSGDALRGSQVKPQLEGAAQIGSAPGYVCRTPLSPSRIRLLPPCLVPGPGGGARLCSPPGVQKDSVFHFHRQRLSRWPPPCPSCHSSLPSGGTESVCDSGPPRPSSRTGERTTGWVPGPAGLTERQARRDFTDPSPSRSPSSDPQE